MIITLSKQTEIFDANRSEKGVRLFCLSARKGSGTNSISLFKQNRCTLNQPESEYNAKVLVRSFDLKFWILVQSSMPLYTKRMSLISTVYNSSENCICSLLMLPSVSTKGSLKNAGARIYRPSFRENKPITLVFSHTKRAFWACFRENWVYNFGQGTINFFVRKTVRVGGLPNGFGRRLALHYGGFFINKRPQANRKRGFCTSCLPKKEGIVWFFVSSSKELWSSLKNSNI